MSSAPSASAVAGPTLVAAAGRSQSSNKISTTRDQPSETDESWLEDWELLTELEDWELLTLPSDRWPASAAAGPSAFVFVFGSSSTAHVKESMEDLHTDQSVSLQRPSASAAAGPEGMIARWEREAARARPKPPAPVPPAPERPANLKESCSCCQHVPSKAPPPGLR